MLNCSVSQFSMQILNKFSYIELVAKNPTGIKDLVIKSIIIFIDVNLKISLNTSILQPFRKICSNEVIQFYH